MLCCIAGGEDHLTQCLSDPGPPGWRGPDLWRNHGPAVGENGTYSTLLYGPEAVKIVKEHPVSNRFSRVFCPLCLFAWQDSWLHGQAHQLQTMIIAYPLQTMILVSPVTVVLLHL